GVYDRENKHISRFYAAHNGMKEVETVEVELGDPSLDALIGKDNHDILSEEIELIDGASSEFDIDQVLSGKLTPVFFGSALTNFGVEFFLTKYLAMTTSPLPRLSSEGTIDPMENEFSAFVFKIQANMNKAHRDRIAFMRICSGKFTAGMEVNHVQGNKKLRLSQPQQLMASERTIIEEAYAGDIIGVFDPGIFSIGDTLCMTDKKFTYEGIPTFSPEHFAKVRQVDTMKRKQFLKGISQIAQEGAIQIFQEYNTGMEEIIVGVVGTLQFDVLKFRLESEYGVEIRLEPLPYEYIRWVENKDIDVSKLSVSSDTKKVKDLKGNPLLLFGHNWSIQTALDRNKGLELSEFGR
ncbi:MAG: peptide chain release factor 3, partial [Herbinix sp.]|nr:peptide chain release factor 3 [Herbinix sp.]